MLQDSLDVKFLVFKLVTFVRAWMVTWAKVAGGASYWCCSMNNGPIAITGLLHATLRFHQGLTGRRERPPGARGSLGDLSEGPLGAV